MGTNDDDGDEYFTAGHKPIQESNCERSRTPEQGHHAISKKGEKKEEEEEKNTISAVVDLVTEHAATGLFLRSRDAVCLIIHLLHHCHHHHHPARRRRRPSCPLQGSSTSSWYRTGQSLVEFLSTRHSQFPPSSSASSPSARSSSRNNPSPHRLRRW